MASITDQHAEGRALALPTVGPADWLIRGSLAGTFLYHGITKFPGLAAGAEMMGLPLWLWTLVAVVETAAGLGILAGGALRSAMGDLATRLSGLGIVATMIGAIWLVHWGQWSNIPSESHPFGGMEFQTLLLATGLFFLLRGNRA
jgi:putative oxidoreductase